MVCQRPVPRDSTREFPILTRSNERDPSSGRWPPQGHCRDDRGDGRVYMEAAGHPNWQRRGQKRQSSPERDAADDVEALGFEDVQADVAIDGNHETRDGQRESANPVSYTHLRAPRLGMISYAV